MQLRRLASLVGATAIIVAACSSSGSSSAPASAQRPRPARRQPAGSGASGRACTVGVSWNNFQQPRWAAHDKPNIQKTVEAAGGTYIDADANLSNEQQATDIDTMISKGAKVLIVLAQDTKAVLPSIKKAKDAGIPVIAYDRLIEDPSALYITFDNVGVGKAEADAVIKKVPKGNYVLIKGDPGDPNAKTFLPSGWDQAGLKDKVASGDIKILGPAGRHLHGRLEDREGPDQHGSDHRQGRRRRHEDRRHPRRERQHGARRRRRAHRQELRLPAPQRSGRRRRQPEQRGARASSTSTSGRTPTSWARPQARPRSRSAPVAIRPP